MKRTNESGRSMVEMLGVLAIIGVLSIGGIRGYSLAMNRYRANEAIDAAAKYAVMVYANAQTYAATHTATEETQYKPTAFDKIGLGTTLPSGVTEIKVADDSGISDDGVNITITFDSEDVCGTVYGILGETNSNGTCTTITHKFAQS